MEILNRTIKALSLKKIEEGQIGFLTTQEDKWYNVAGEPETLKELVKNVIAKGNTVEFEFDNGVVGSLKLIEVAKKEDKNWHDDMTNFEDLLAAAHKKFNSTFSISTELIQVDFKEKIAVFKAKVHDRLLDQVFEAHGDAEGIGSDMIKPHFMRMAETRAIARALRWATNNANVAKEEC